MNLNGFGRRCLICKIRLNLINEFFAGQKNNLLHLTKQPLKYAVSEINFEHKFKLNCHIIILHRNTLLTD
jgi:hypothetical protein